VTETESPPRVSAVPRRLRLVCALGAAVVVAAMTVGVVEFGWVDQVAIIGVGVCLGAGILTFGRSRVDADASGVAVRNLFVRHVFPWSAVRAVRFDRHSSWASLALTNGDEVSVLAIQAGDREHAVRAVEGLRALLARARAAEPPRIPLLYED
jgi:hypothetical protein